MGGGNPPEEGFTWPLTVNEFGRVSAFGRKPPFR